MHLHIVKVFYLPTDAQENYFKKNNKIYIKTAPTCRSFKKNVNFNILFKAMGPGVA